MGLLLWTCFGCSQLDAVGCCGAGISLGMLDVVIFIVILFLMLILSMVLFVFMLRFVYHGVGGAGIGVFVVSSTF